MTNAKQGGGLQIVFAIFLGLMVTAFVGVGIHTFYPSPQPQLTRQIQELERQELAALSSKAPDALTDADRARIQAIRDERDESLDAAQAAREVWGRNTSMMLVALATLAMSVSLVRAPQLPVLGQGLLLGGVFTMIYGVGWIIATGTSIARFLVMTLALAITVALGYVRFVRRQPASPAAGGTRTGPGRDLADLEERVRALERRMAEAADVLGRKIDR